MMRISRAKPLDILFVLFGHVCLALFACDFYTPMQDYSKKPVPLPPAPTYSWHTDTLWSKPFVVQAGFAATLIAVCDTALKADSISVHLERGTSDTAFLIVDSEAPLITIPWIAAHAADLNVQEALVLRYRTADSVTNSLVRSVRLRAKMDVLARAAQSMQASAAFDTTITVASGDSLLGHVYGTASIDAMLTDSSSTPVHIYWQRSVDGSEIALPFSTATTLHYGVQNVSKGKTAVTDTLRIVRNY